MSLVGFAAKCRSYSRVLVAAVGMLSLAVIIVRVIAGYGQGLEQNAFPPVSQHTMVAGSIHRTPMALCWSWQATHYRTSSAVEWDFHMTDNRGHTYSFVPLRDANGPNPEDLKGGDIPQLSESIKPGADIVTSWCTPISRLVKPGDVLTVYGRVRIKGFLGLWTVWHQLPTFSAEGLL